MPRYTDDSRERVRVAVDMPDLVGTRTELKRSGGSQYMGRCCFHEERSPSLSVDADRKLYHCFGCGAGGDAFTFVQESEGVDFGGAIEWLAARYGVALEIVDDDPKAAARRKREGTLLALVERAAGFYERLLWDAPEGKAAREYLLGRGLTEEALRAFRVGFAPNAWDRLASASAKAGVDEKALIDAGLAMRKKGGRGVNDRFHHRITFPLCDARGQVRGFGARAMTAEQKPKYLNTSENELFHKGRQLFGLHLARSAAAKTGVVVLVEGYTDVIALRQSGVEHAVALMGTAMTPEQVKELARLAPLLVLALDPDGAGEAAMEKAYGLAAGSRLDLRVASLPDGKDPADLVQEGRAEELVAALAAPVHFARFRVDRLLKTADLSSAELRDEALAKLAPVLASLGEGALREELVVQVADRLSLGPAIVDRVVRATPPPPRGASGGPGAGSPVGGGGGSGGRWGAGGARSSSRDERGEPAGAPGSSAGWTNGADGPVGGGSPIDRDVPDWAAEESAAWAAGPGGGPDRGARASGVGAGSAGDRGRRDGGAPSGADRPVRHAPMRLDPYDAQERALLAIMLALGDAGRAQLASLDLDDLRVPHVRAVAAWLKEGGDEGGQLPDDEELAHVARDVVIRAGSIDARPAVLEVELAQLELRRLERQIASARREGTPVDDLHRSTQAVRERLDAAMASALDG